MRIICPNCEAHYEIEAEAIPPGGRDVQCSACGHNWFQSPEQAGSGLPPQDYDDLPEDIAATEEADAPELDEAEPRPSLDPALRAFLREEAEREAAARRDEAQGAAPATMVAEVAAPEREVGSPEPDVAVPLEQPAAGGSEHEAADELRFRTPLGEAATAPQERKPVPADREAETPETEPSPTSMSSRAEPGDGEEAPLPIAARTAAPDAVAQPALETSPASAGPELTLDDEVARRRGFRMGFIGMLLIAGGALWLFVYGRGLPDPGPFLGGYVETMEAGRVVLVERLDGAVDSLVRLTIGD